LLLWIFDSQRTRYLWLFGSSTWRRNAVKQAIMICALGALTLAFSNRTWASIARTHVDIAHFSNAHESKFLPARTDPYISHLPKVSAYIDPGTGSFIIQLLLGFLFGGLFAIKLFWSRMKRFFRKLRKK